MWPNRRLSPGKKYTVSMSLQSVNDRLLIALNGNGTGQFDPRPAVAKFLCAKQRRYREPQLEKYSK